MPQEQTNTIRMMYNGKLENISCAIDSNYEEFIDSAIERFAVPAEFKYCLQITDEFKNIFEKDTFEYFIGLFPNPGRIFYVRVNSTTLSNKAKSEKRKALSKLNNKREICDEDEEDVGVPVTRLASFYGVYPGTEISELDEPKTQRPKTDVVKKKAKMSRKTIRV